nr:uncharacterized protein LOC129267727 [Lytechinus pictus]
MDYHPPPPSCASSMSVSSLSPAPSSSPVPPSPSHFVELAIKMAPTGRESVGRCGDAVPPEYLAEKNIQEQMDGTGRITCKFYSELQEIFGGRPETAPVAILASQPEEEDQSESLDSVDSDSLPREEEEDGAEEDRSITDDELEENDVEAPTELVGNFPPEDLEGPSTSSANGRKATGEKRKKSKLQESFGLIAKEIKTLEEDSTNAFNAREDRFMQRQMEWERELLMKAQRTEEKN